MASRQAPIFLLVLVVLLAVVVVVESSLLEEALERVEHDHGDRELLKRDQTGVIYAKCPCNEGLDCVLTVGGRFCYPLTCLREAAATTYATHDSFVDDLLADAGVDRNGIFNASLATAKSAEAVVRDPRYIVRRGVRERIHAALRRDTGLLDTFRRQARDCFPVAEQSDGDPLQVQSFYSGIHIEQAFFAKVVLQLGAASYDNGTIPSEGCYADVCLGGGIDIDAHFAPVVGVLSSGNPGDIRSGSVMFDADASLIGHIGGAVGTTFGGVCRSEFTTFFNEENGLFGLGMGGGVGMYFCANDDPSV